jgi:LacI family transcriptional regulator
MKLHAAAPSTGVGFIFRAGVRLHTQSNFFGHVQHGLHCRLLERGFYSVFLGSEDDLEIRAVQQVLRKHPLCGVAVFGEVGMPFLQGIKAAQPNLVAISFTAPGLCHSAMPNEKQAVEFLVSHLVELGHTQIGWIGGDKGLDYNRRRFDLLSASLESRGMSLNRKQIVEVETGDRLAGWKAAELLLGQTTARTAATAYVCVNGSVARGFINGLMRKGWRVPEQISVVAIDATNLCTEEHPQITGAHADPEKIGITAANLLLESAEKKDGVLSDTILPATLTIRETSAKAL